MLCQKCGTENVDGTKFCSSCGAQLTATQQSTILQPSQTNVAPKKKKGALGKIVIAILAVIIIISLFSGGGYEKTVDAFFEGMFEGKATTMIGTFSDDYLEEQMDFYGCDSKSEYKKELQNTLDMLQKEYKSQLGKKWKYEYKIVDVLEEDDEMEVMLTVELSGNESKEEGIWFLYLVKDGSKWYVDGFSS